MERTFRARSDAMRAAEKQKKKQFIQAGGYTILMIMAFVYRGEEIARKLAKDFNADVSSVRGFLTFLGFGFLFMGIMSVILGVIADKKIQRLASSFLVLKEEGVVGMSFTSVDSQGTQFFVEYRDIQHALLGNGEQNLIIETKHLSYYCLEIDCAEKVAEAINKKVASPEMRLDDACRMELLQMSEDDTSSVVTDTEGAYFLNVDSEYVVCPFCNTKQSSKLSSCTGCGVAFIFEKSGVSPDEPTLVDSVPLSAYCPYCGAKYLSEGSFCAACGSRRRSG